ncbi:MAG: hypothetical protein JWM53_2004 [bacterium]|nr:hypothetical protein [bacterium]
MRESTRRPGAQANPEGPESADGADTRDGAGQQQLAQQQRAHKRRDAAHDADAAAFNERHAAEAAEFGRLTNDACLGEDGKLDAAAVKEWQREHGVTPDGKIGPKTLAAAGGSGTDGKVAGQAASAGAGARLRAKGPVDEIDQWLDLEAATRISAEAARSPSSSRPRVATARRATMSGSRASR